MTEKGYSLREIIDELRREELETELFKLKEELSDDNLKEEDILVEIEETCFEDEYLSKFKKETYIRRKMNHFNDFIDGKFINLDPDEYKSNGGIYHFPEKMKDPIKDILGVTDSDNGNFFKKYHKYYGEIRELEREYSAAYRKYIESDHSKKAQKRYEEIWEKLEKKRQKLNELNFEKMKSITEDKLNNFKKSYDDEENLIDKINGIEFMMVQMFKHKAKLKRSIIVNNLNQKNVEFINKVTKLNIEDRFETFDSYFNELNKNMDITQRKLKMELKLANKVDHKLKEQISLYKSVINKLD